MGWVGGRYASLVAQTNRPVVVMCGVSAIIGLGFGLVGPILPLYAETFRTSLTMVGLLVGALSLARLVSNLPGGYLADIVGYRRVLILSSLVIGGGALGSGLTTDFRQLFAFQILLGIGAGFFHTTGFALMARLSNTWNRVRMLTAYQGCFMLAAIFGPTIGGIAAQMWGYRVPFLGFALLAGLASALIYWGVFQAGDRSERTPVPVAEGRDLERAAGSRSAVGPQEIRDQGWRVGGVFRLLSEPAFLLVTFWGFCTWFARRGLQGTVVPLLGATRLGLSEGEIGFAYTLMGIMSLLAMLLVSGSISVRYGRKAAIVPSTLVMAIALMLFACSREYSVFLLSAGLLGAGSGAIGPVPIAYVSDMVPSASYGSSLGLYRSLRDLGAFLGAVAAGWIMDRAEVAVPLYLGAVVLILGATCFGAFASDTRRVAVPPALPIGPSDMQ